MVNGIGLATLLSVIISVWWTRWTKMDKVYHSISGHHHFGKWGILTTGDDGAVTGQKIYHRVTGKRNRNMTDTPIHTALVYCRTGTPNIAFEKWSLLSQCVHHGHLVISVLIKPGLDLNWNFSRLPWIAPQGSFSAPSETAFCWRFDSPRDACNKNPGKVRRGFTDIKRLFGSEVN